MMEAIRHATDRLIAAGYRQSFRADREGLHVLPSDALYAPEDLIVDDVLRFEGESDPDEQAVLFALRARSGGVKGTYLVPFGPAMPLADARAVERLPMRGRRPSPELRRTGRE
jgi:hypothetical protein